MNRLAAIGSRTKILSGIVVGVSCLLAFCPMPAHGQQSDMQQKMADMKGSMAKNKQALAQYTWKEQVIISLKGEQKKTQNFQVRMGSDGKPQKTSLDQPQQQAQDAGGRGGRFRQRVVAKKKEEYEDYAEQMKALAQQYIPPDKDAIQAAYAKGNVSFTASADSPNEI